MNLDWILKKRSFDQFLSLSSTGLAATKTFININHARRDTRPTAQSQQTSEQASNEQARQKAKGNHAPFNITHPSNIH